MDGGLEAKINEGGESISFMTVTSHASSGFMRPLVYENAQAYEG